MPNDLDLKQLLATALARHEAGEFDLAEAGYRAVLRHDPDEPDALNLLGVIMQERGALDQAIDLLTRALTIEPEFPEALSNLSRARRLMGDPAVAADLARRAIAQDAGMAEAHLNLGRALLDLGNAAGAVVALRQAAALSSGSADVLAQLSEAQIKLDDAQGIAGTLTEALALDPGRVDAMINLGVALLALDRVREALTWHEKAVSLLPDSPVAHAALAMTLRRKPDLPGAIAACRRTLELAPHRVDIWLTLGANLGAMGRFAEAGECWRKVLELKPDSTEARRELAVVGRHDAGLAEVPRLRATLDDAHAPRRERIAAGMAVGTLLDRAGDFDGAFAAFAGANRLIRAQWREAGKDFDGRGLRRYTAWAEQVYTPTQLAAVAGWGDPSELPVFIVGMPRSGTSLVEQILASHPRVFGAGELKDVTEIVQGLNQGDRHLEPARWGRDAVRLAAAAQIGRLRGLGGPATYVTDKMPDNCQMLGQIAVLFPRARVIVCRRDLRDVCLSCHFQQFGEGLVWTTDLTDMALRARCIERLLRHWLKVLPLRILEVQYEDMVRDPEAQSRRLIDFLGLEWDPACLAFHETERPVLTASVWQVRQPLYATSVGRWRNYRAHLGPLLEGLKGVLPADE
jgi:tetratricopeptide (TPR) repeat protein